MRLLGKLQKGRLLINNCKTHGTVNSVVALNNAKVPFLPPNPTSKIQPIDAGMIASVIMRYRLARLNRVTGLMKSNFFDI